MTIVDKQKPLPAAPVDRVVGQVPKPLKSSTEWEHDGDLPFILDYLIECAQGWEPKARLLGNARAEDVIRAIVRIKNKAAWYAMRVDRLQAVQMHMRDPERKWVCDIIANGVTHDQPNPTDQRAGAPPASMHPVVGQLSGEKK